MNAFTPFEYEIKSNFIPAKAIWFERKPYLSLV